MHPVLIWLNTHTAHFGVVPIRAYGAFVGAALVAGMSVVVRYGRRVGLPGEKLLDAIYAAVVAGLVGGRLMYVVVHAADFKSDPLSALKVWEGGMMYFGGLVMGILVGSYVAIRMGLPIWRSVDCVAPAIGAGQAVGRVACLAAGCCYGKPWDGSLAIRFHDTLAAVPPTMLGTALIPTQALQIAEGLLLWALGAWLFRHRKWDGQAFLWTVAAAGVTRALLEELRGDAARGFLMPGTFGESLPSSRVLGIVMVLVALGVTIARSARVRAVASPSTV